MFSRSARLSGAHQSIILITEMIFNCLIANVAQKAEKVQSLKVWKFQKILKFSKFLIFEKYFLIFMNFKLMDFHGF